MIKKNKLDEIIAKLNEISAVVAEIAKDQKEGPKEGTILKEGTIWAPEAIIEKVNDEFQVYVTKKGRAKGIVEARFAAVYLLSQYTKLTLQEIAKKTGNTNHTTAIYARHKAEIMNIEDSDFRTRIQRIKQRL